MTEEEKVRMLGTKDVKVYKLADLSEDPYNWLTPAEKSVQRIVDGTLKLDARRLLEDKYDDFEDYGDVDAIVLIEDDAVWLLTGTSDLQEALEILDTNPPYKDLPKISYLLDREWEFRNSRDYGHYHFDFGTFVAIIPPWVENTFDMSIIEAACNGLAEQKVDELREKILQKFDWVEAIWQVGRWLAIEADETFLGECPENVEDVKALEKRVEDLVEIEKMVQETKRQYREEIRSELFWRQLKNDTQGSREVH